MGSPAPFPARHLLPGLGRGAVLSLWPPLLSTPEHHSLLPSGRGASRASLGFCNGPGRAWAAVGGESVGAGGRCLCDLCPGMRPGRPRRWAQRGRWASSLATPLRTWTSASPSSFLPPQCLLPPSLGTLPWPSLSTPRPDSTLPRTHARAVAPLVSPGLGPHRWGLLGHHCAGPEEGPASSLRRFCRHTTGASRIKAVVAPAAAGVVGLRLRPSRWRSPAWWAGGGWAPLWAAGDRAGL